MDSNLSGLMEHAFGVKSQNILPKIGSWTFFPSVCVCVCVYVFTSGFLFTNLFFVYTVRFRSSFIFQLFFFKLCIRMLLVLMFCIHDIFIRPKSLYVNSFGFSIYTPHYKKKGSFPHLLNSCTSSIFLLLC